MKDDLMEILKGFFLAAIFLVLIGCDDKPLNNPYPQGEENTNAVFSSFMEQPKTLDPARSYTVDESVFTAAIYQPPLQYHYLKRPYELIPASALLLPTKQFFNQLRQPLPDNAPINDIAYTVYDIKIKPDIYYENHPCFAKNAQGEFLYHHLSASDLSKIKSPNDFAKKATRELTADDYIYEIKRLAHPDVQSPILGLLGEHILGLKDYATLLMTYRQAHAHSPLDLRKWDFEGVKKIDRYHYQIVIKGVYSQFIYWLAMPFFAPVPWEADQFYAQNSLRQKNMSLDTYPVGTGAYRLIENNPNRRMILEKNANFNTERYPSVGMPLDAEKGLLANAGKKIPFVEQFIYSLEKETIPEWNKFLQGYYDRSGINSDSFDEAIHIDTDGRPMLTKDMQDKGIHLETEVDLGVFFIGFNMLDKVVGGNSLSAKKIRQAIAIAIDTEEYISIFLNGRGMPAQGPIPPGIFGYELGKKGMNPYVYNWVDNHRQRKSLTVAKQLLKEAGYPNGINATTGEPLVINYDAYAARGSDDKAQIEWMRKQFAKLGIQLQIRSTDYNRFQEKMRTGNDQLFLWGWQADYPDPENFLFLLYGPNSIVKAGGENMSNYENARYDRLYEKMRVLPNDASRQQLIDEMLDIARQDTALIWLFHRKTFSLEHVWNKVNKPLDIGGSSNLKYRQVDPALRLKKQNQWNQPTYWPLYVIAGMFMLIVAPVVIRYWYKEHQPPILIKTKNDS